MMMEKRYRVIFKNNSGTLVVSGRDLISAISKVGVKVDDIFFWEEL